METECEDYLEPLSWDLNGGMGVVISNWDDKEGRTDFERDQTPNPDGSCGKFYISTM